MEFDVEVRKLSQDFYTAYPRTQYPEILEKGSRAYTCLLIDTHDDYLICVPFRSEMSHNQGFHFVGTARSMQSRSGLDYKKSVIINNMDYISSDPAIVDSDEYAMMMSHINSIVESAVSYVNTYIQHVNGTNPLHPREFNRRYLYSTLPYFHDILGI